MGGRRAVSVAAALLGVALLGGGCVAPSPPPRPSPPPPTEVVVRRNPWLAQNFDELTPSRQARVVRRMMRARPPLATTREAARQRWDAMGLEERRALIAPATRRRAARRSTVPPPRHPATPLESGATTAGTP